MLRKQPDHRAGGGQHTPARLKRRLLLSVALFTAGAALLALQMLFPAQLERAIGEVRVAVTGTVSDIAQQISPESHDSITLGPLGGRREMNWCDGRFIEMESYRISGVLPVYAAHNNCGGAVILSWELGDTVKVSGSDALYEVVAERHTKKWDNIASLRGMEGELLVQTCFFGQNKMRFLALAPTAQ